MARSLKMHKMTFPEGKLKALTLSYDDGVLQDKRLIALMRKYGVKGTFNLNSGRLSRVLVNNFGGHSVDFSTCALDEIADIYDGFEVSTHGRTHCGLTNLGPLALTEILEDRKAFESVLPYLVRGHAYPFGLFDESVKAMLKAAGIKYARTIVSTHSFVLPTDYLAWNPTCHHTEPCMMDLARKFCENENFFREMQLFYLWGHTYEFDQFDNWSLIEEFLAYVSGFQDTIWMATNGEIVEYLEACKSITFSADGTKAYNPSQTAVWINTEDWDAPSSWYCIEPGQLVNLERKS